MLYIARPTVCLLKDQTTRPAMTISRNQASFYLVITPYCILNTDIVATNLK